MVEPTREGYVFIGNIGVDSGMIVIGDPLLILPARTEAYKASGYDPTKEDVIDLLKEELAAGFVEGPGGETIAIASSTGYGDGTYPVSCKLDKNRRVVEIVVDMAMTDFQKQLFGK